MSKRLIVFSLSLIVLLLCSVYETAFATNLTPAPASLPNIPADITDPTDVLNLEGFWLFHAGDNPGFSHPDFDDANWEKRQIPTAHLPWRFRWQGFAWYRHHVRLDEKALGHDFAIAIGSAREVVELFINGVIVSRQGHFGSRPTGGDRFMPLVALIPATLWRAGDNVIAIRMLDPTWASGIVSGPLILGAPATIYQSTEWSQKGVPAIHFLLASLALFIGLAQLLTVRGRWASRESLWLAGTGVGLATALLGGTSILNIISPVLELTLRLPMIGATIAVYCAASLFATRYDELGATHVKWGRKALLVLIAAILLVPESVVFLAAAPAVLVAALVVSLYAAYLLAQAARRQEPYTVPVFASVILLALLLIYDGFTASDTSLLPMPSLAGAVFVLVITALLAVRQAIFEHESAITRLRNLEDIIDTQQGIGVLDASAMSIVDVDHFLDVVLHEAVREIGVSRCSLMLERNSHLVLVASVGLPKHTLGTEISLSNTIAGWVFQNGEAISNKNIPEHLSRLPRAGQYATPSFIAQPIKHENTSIGVLSVSDRADAGEFSLQDENTVSEIAWKLALVLTRA
ncbi:MAG: GAF domain-containing protein [Deltaproteobacteria bacterium]|nr:GAF domain-containing protein [Deltaproteobacteria bacterium]